ncbi:hypothetical protein NCPPB940_25760 [Xanthomonas hortorum pv. taraxaci]|nr:hypothetical protein NCPPB940_25760 [Xanthomonas hortorum pv. taraxaci]CAD0337503.1 hypothetical protein NCPPB940_25760 [Xanthomonas hortorum pv. taraxaci]
MANERNDEKKWADGVETYQATARDFWQTTNTAIMR